jgi:hypothetical protein
VIPPELLPELPELPLEPEEPEEPPELPPEPASPDAVEALPPHPMAHTIPRIHIGRMQSIVAKAHARVDRPPFPN